jgi:hypothetical protein
VTSFAVEMSNGNFAFKKLINGDQAFIIFSLRFLPGGVKQKIDQGVNEIGLVEE